jgi:hypothetical protein
MIEWSALEGLLFDGIGGNKGHEVWHDSLSKCCSLVVGYFRFFTFKGNR